MLIKQIGYIYLFEWIFNHIIDYTKLFKKKKKKSFCKNLYKQHRGKIKTLVNKEIKNQICRHDWKIENMILLCQTDENNFPINWNKLLISIVVRKTWIRDAWRSNKLEEKKKKKKKRECGRCWKKRKSFEHRSCARCSYYDAGCPIRSIVSALESTGRVALEPRSSGL